MAPSGIALLQNCEDAACRQADAHRQHKQRCGGGSGEAPAQLAEHGSERRHAGNVESHEEGEDQDLCNAHHGSYIRGSQGLHEHQEREFFSQHAENQGETHGAWQAEQSRQRRERGIDELLPSIELDQT